MPDFLGYLSAIWLVVLADALALLASLLGAFLLLSCRSPRRQTGPAPEHAALDGIRGWLILVTIGAATRIYYYGKTLYIDFDLVLHPAKWSALTAKDGRLYDPFWYPSMLFETGASLILLVAVILSFVLLFQRRFTYPFLMIGIFVGSIVFHVVDHLLVHQIRVIHHDDHAFVLLMLRLILASAIWIPYLLVSKRVRATFWR